MDREWMPIETAPKRVPSPGANVFVGDPQVLLAYSDGTVITGFWEPGRDEGGGWDQGGAGQWLACGLRMRSQPTHWMPLPELPKDES